MYPPFHSIPLSNFQIEFSNENSKPFSSRAALFCISYSERSEAITLQNFLQNCKFAKFQRYKIALYKTAFFVKFLQSVCNHFCKFANFIAKCIDFYCKMPHFLQTFAQRLLTVQKIFLHNFCNFYCKIVKNFN